MLLKFPIPLDGNPNIVFWRNHTEMYLFLQAKKAQQDSEEARKENQQTKEKFQEVQTQLSQVL